MLLDCLKECLDLGLVPGSVLLLVRGGLFLRLAGDGDVLGDVARHQAAPDRQMQRCPQASEREPHRPDAESGPWLTAAFPALGDHPVDEALDVLLGQLLEFLVPEVGGGRAFPLRGGWDAVLTEDLPDRGGGDLDAQRRELTVDPAIPPRAVFVGQAQDQDQDADRADSGRAAASPRYASRGMAPLEQVPVPAMDGVRAYQQEKVAQLVHREVVEQAGEDSAVSGAECGLADLTLQDQQLMPQRQDLDVFVPVAHRQQAKEREGVGCGEVGQAQQHDRS